MFRAALVGCGRIGSAFADDPIVSGTYSHAGAYEQCEKTTLVAVCDVDRGAAERCAARGQGVRAFTDLSSMLDETAPDLVSVCTPDATHAAVIERVLACGAVKGILAEKPLALNMADAERLARHARENGVTLAVNYSRRYTRGHQAIHHRLASGELGSIQTVTGRYTKGVIHNGTHWFDLARWLIGDVTSVHACLTTERREDDMDLDVYLRFQNGARGALLASCADAFSIFEMDIVGTAGRILLYDSGHRVQRWEVRDSDRYSGYRKPFLIEDAESDMRDSTLHAVNDLAQCIERRVQPRCSGDDAVSALRIGAQAMQSALEGRAMTVAVTA